MVESNIFAINRQLYCLWGHDLRQRNLSFLSGFDAEYFDYIARTNVSHLESETDRQRAAMSLRIAYHHGAETLFSLIAGMLQAPRCIYAWLDMSRTEDLRFVVSSITQGEHNFLTNVNIDEISWDRVSRAVHAYSHREPDAVTRIAKLYAEFWQYAAIRFVSDDDIREYNGLKHSLRVRPGGFALAVGIEKQYGVAPPPEEMTTLANSDFGCSFYSLEHVGRRSKKNRSYRAKQRATNWSVEATARALQLISMSIANVVANLKIMNGVPASEVKFLLPAEEYDQVLASCMDMPTVSNFSFDFVLPEAVAVETTSDDLTEIWEKSRSAKSEV